MRFWLALCWAAVAWGHDAPAQVTVQVYLRPAGGAMRALVRIPLEAVRDVDFPAVEGGYLDVAALQPRLGGLAKLWVADHLRLLENGRAVGAPRVTATQISMESDRSFASFEQADARLRAPLPGAAEKLFWKQVFFDVGMEYPIGDTRARFSIQPAFADLGERVQTVLHYGDRVFLLDGDREAFPLEPSVWQAAGLFVRMGFLHILEGTDHLLFLVCLVLPLRQFGRLVWVITAFTAAHSVTLIASALDMAPGALWFPPAVEWLIAVSIVFMALANIAGRGGQRSWMLAFGFGLVHGFGFSFALRESMQFAGGHLAAALAAFNVGVELGQLAVLALLVPGLSLLLRYVVEERTGVVAASAVVAHTAWHWMGERWERLGRYSISAPAMDAAAWALVLKWILVGMVLWALGWMVNRRISA